MVRSPERQAETQTFITSSCSAPPKRVAIGIAPLGIVSIGIVPMGVVSIGVVPMGVVSLGVVGMGVLNACLVGMGVAVAGLNAMGLVRRVDPTAPRHEAYGSILGVDEQRKNPSLTRIYYLKTDCVVFLDTFR